MFQQIHPEQSNVTIQLFLAAALIVTTSHSASGQVANAINQNVYKPSFGAETAFSAQLKAEADAIRAYGEAGLNLSHARHEVARSVHLELHNWVDSLGARQARRKLGEAEGERLHVNPFDRRTAQVALELRQLFEAPELAEVNIISGRDLNFLVQQLATQEQFRNRRENLLTDDRFRLAPAIIDAVRLRERLPGQCGIPFTLRSQEPLAVINWPPPLRDERLYGVRSRFLQTHNRLVIAALDSRVANSLVKECLTALDELKSAYSNWATRERRLESVEQHGLHKQSLELLGSLEKQVTRIGETAGRVLHLLPWVTTPEDLVTIVQGMHQRGLEFAPCDPGDEAAYYELFGKLKLLFGGQPPYLAQVRHR